MVIENVIDIRAVIAERQSDAVIESRALVYRREDGTCGERLTLFFRKMCFLPADCDFL